jgi:cholesterol transport system auxiliary component
MMHPSLTASVAPWAPPKRPLLAIYLIAAYALLIWARGNFYRKIRVTLGCASALALGACATPQAPLSKAVYDFGPLLSAPASAAQAGGPAISLAAIDASAALETTQVLYRLAYANAQQLRPYASARWSMPPAQLLRLRLRDALSARGAVLGSTEAAGWVLKIELDEFSHLFDSPTSSSGIVRLQASLLQGGNLVAQRSLLARASALSPDAPGGVRALTTATDDAVQQLSGWVAQQVK